MATDVISDFGLGMAHLTRRKGSITFSGGGGGKPALGAVQPCLRQVACTSEPRLGLNLAFVTKRLGITILVPGGGVQWFIVVSLVKVLAF